MIKVILVLNLFFVTTLLKGQPILYYSEMAPFGTEFYYKHVAFFDDIDTTIQGSDVTWNFTSLIADNDSDYIITIFNPATTIHASTFPTANYGVLESPELYNFFEMNSDQMSRLGHWKPADGYTTYSNLQVELKFPLTSTLQWMDSSQRVGRPSVEAISSESIGYGTLNVPGHVYPEVIMNRYIYYYFGMRLVEYIWYNTSNGQPCLAYFPVNTIGIDPAAIYQYGNTIGIKEIPEISGLQYNNPCIDFLNVTFVNNEVKDLQFEIINSLGMVIKSDHLEKSSLQKISINLTSEQTGLYLLLIKDHNSNRIIKSVKILKL
jgi:hypothetical protein